MNEHLANIIARTEHAQRAHTPILDFDRRGYVYTPGWLEQNISMLRRSMIGLIASLKGRVLMHDKRTVTHEMPVSENY